MDQLVRLATEPALAECAGQDLRVWQCTSLVALDTLYKNSNTACTICRRHMFAKTNKQSPEKKATGGGNKNVPPATCAVALYNMGGGSM